MRQVYALVLSFLLFSPLAARPLAIEFYEMMEQSKMIVIANSVKPIGGDTYNATFYEINILSVLKGKQITGIYKVSRAQGAASMPEGTIFVAFINHKNQFEWYGMPAEENVKELNDNSILSLAGFYDYNAYLVSPSTISLGQMKDYIKTKKYNTHVTGNIYCFNNVTKQVEPTSAQIDVDYTYTNGEITSSAKVNGISWKDFPLIPTINVSAWEREIEIEYEPNGYRGFKLKGEILPTPNLNGDQVAIFWVTEPEELNFDELNQYLTDNIHGYPCYDIEVVTDKNEIYPMVLGDEMGRIGWINYNGKQLGISSYNVDPYWPREMILDYNFYDKLVIKLDSIHVTKDQLNYSYEKLVRELKINPIKASIVIRNSKEEETFVTNCELRYKATRFTKNINYGK